MIKRVLNAISRACMAPLARRKARRESLRLGACLKAMADAAHERQRAAYWDTLEVDWLGRESLPPADDDIGRVVPVIDFAAKDF